MLTISPVDASARKRIRYGGVSNINYAIKPQSMSIPMSIVSTRHCSRGPWLPWQRNQTKPGYIYFPLTYRNYGLNVILIQFIEYLLALNDINMELITLICIIFVAFTFI